MILCGCLALGVLQPAQGAVDFVFGMLADAAGVEQNRVGLGWRIDQFVTVFAERRDNELAIEHVHLAADGFDVETLGHGGDGRESGVGSQEANE